VGEAANTSVYLINKSSSSASNYKTPIETWSGRLKNYENLKMFDVLTFAHVKNDKLD